MKNLMQILEEDHESEFLPIYFDFKEFADFAGNSNISRVFVSHVFSICKKRYEILGVEHPFFSSTIEFDHSWHKNYKKLEGYPDKDISVIFKECLKRLASQLERTFVFLFDNFELLFSTVLDNPQGYYELGRLVEEFWKPRKRVLLFIVAGRKSWESVCSEVGSLELNLIGTGIVYLSSIRFEAFQKYYNDQMDHTGHPNIPSAKTLYSQLGGVVYWTHVLVQSVSSGSSFSRHILRPHFRHLLRNLSMEEREILRSVLLLLPKFSIIRARELADRGLLKEKIDGSFEIRGIWWAAFLKDVFGIDEDFGFEEEIKEIKRKFVDHRQEQAFRSLGKLDFEKCGGRYSKEIVGWEESWLELTQSKPNLDMRIFNVRRRNFNKEFFKFVSNMKPSVNQESKPTDLNRDMQEKKKILLIGTEWFSKHGGLSTFNRELCIRLAALGHDVFCLVPSWSDDEYKSAQTNGVKLLSNDTERHVNPIETLGHPISAGCEPDIIISHGLKTGPYGGIQKSYFPNSKWIQFVHIVPQEIAWQKTKPLNSSIAEKAERKQKEQADIAKNADLVAAVGPKLHREMELTLSRLEKSPPLFQFDPGLFHTTLTPNRPRTIICLLMARAEDDKLKGLDIAAHALGKVSQSVGDSTQMKLQIRGAQPKNADTLRNMFMEATDLKTNQLVVYPYSDSLESLNGDLRSSSIVLMPSRAEGYGLVALEALSAGIPILSSKESGFGEAIQNLGAEFYRYFVVSTEGENSEVYQRWADRIDAIFLDLDSAFKKTGDLQKKFSETYSWEESINSMISVLSF